MMAVSLDLDMEDGEGSYDDNMTADQMDVSGDATGMDENEDRSFYHDCYRYASIGK